jgi:hypothetical protein
MKKRKNKIPSKLGSHKLTLHTIKRVKERGISVSDLEMALKHGEIDGSILRYKHLEIVLSENESNLITAWNNGKEKSSTVISKKEQKILTSKFSKNHLTKKEQKNEKPIEFENYEDYLDFLKSKV